MNGENIMPGNADGAELGREEGSPRLPQVLRENERRKGPVQEDN